MNWRALSTVVLVISLSACARLDENLFEPEKVSSYRFDSYTGEVTFDVDETINPEWINQINLISHDGESEATIKAVYLGELLDKGTADERVPPNIPVILFCHGNREHMDYYWPRVKLLANSGGFHSVGVLTLDYRGYGASTGEPSEKGLYADVDAAIKWLEERDLTSANFIMYGYSMGTAPVVELAANPRSALIPGKIILEAPFASAEIMVQDASLLALPGSYVTDLKIDNANEIRKLSQTSLLWLHGEQDDFIDINTHGAVVFKNHPGQNGVDKYAIRVASAGHNDIPLKMGLLPDFGDYKNLIYSFASTGSINQE